MTGFLNPSEVLKQIKLKQDMVAADFGCGSGGWVIPLSRHLAKGRVYAIDILEEPLSALRAKLKAEKISNIEIIRADVESGSKLQDNSCDLVLMTNLLFQVEDIKKVLEEGKRVLKGEGKILAVDWKKGAPFGPKGKILPEKVKEIAKEIGLELEREFEAGAYHWGLVFEKTI
ncbi:class I SAM-dependent methyltransferase [Patescibacteria group bacterium]|nr:class I SAM-dependent methyltransferase [Patescibacteria group bacterium]